MVVILCVMCFHVHGQNVGWHLDSLEFLIGDQTALHLELITNESIEQFNPKVELLTAGGVEFVRKKELRKSQQGGQYHSSQDIIIALFDTGYIEVPAMPIQWSENGQIKYDTLPAIPIHVSGHIEDRPDIAPIKPIVREPWNFFKSPWWYLLLGALVLCGIVWLVYRRLRKRDQVHTEDPDLSEMRDVRTPYQRALDRLDELGSLAVDSDHRTTKDYLSSISTIIRQYLDEAWQISAPESTTDEIIHALSQSQKVPSTLIATLANYLRRIDMIKFAKMVAMAEEKTHAATTAKDVLSAFHQEQFTLTDEEE